MYCVECPAARGTCLVTNYFTDNESEKESEDEEEDEDENEAEG